MPVKSAILRILQTTVRALQLCCAIIIAGIFIYFFVDGGSEIREPDIVLAVIGMSAAAVLYAGCGVILTLCLAGYSFTGAIAIFLDVCFIGCFAAIAYFSRDRFSGLRSVENDQVLPVVAFALAIIAIFLFLLSAVLQVFIVRRRKRDKRYGPSPANNYTSGEGRQPLWKRGLGKWKAKKRGEKTHHDSAPNQDYMNSTQTGMGADPRYGQQTSGQPYGQTYGQSYDQPYDQQMTGQTGGGGYQGPPKNAATNY